MITYKLAAHAADLAKGHPGAQVRDNALSKLASSSAGKTNLTCRSTQIPRVLSMMKPCLKSLEKLLTSVRCVDQSSAL